MRFTVKEFQKEYSAFMKDSNSEKLARAFFEKNHEKLPKFFSDRLVSPNFYDLSKKDYLRPCLEREVPIDCIYGFSWLFEDFDSPDVQSEGRPLAERLARIFCDCPDRIVNPIPLVQIGENRYIANDGNHRIYSAYLRSWQSVPAWIEGTLYMENTN